VPLPKPARFKRLADPGLPPMGAFSLRVYGVLKAHTASPWPIMRAQCQRRGIDARSLDAKSLAVVIPDLAAAVGKYASLRAGLAAQQDLGDLLLDAEAFAWSLDEVG